ncbi:hypothetical protein RBA41_23715 [Massilia sp. CCM 9210]|uniref:hypothetical protein n=1 Tax=Massilia scottii TaxID=3057166 RepID=UPI002796DC25|nr:hypothetical protein [Massilia sp. CCM 9210]MDQ1816308.1 hypothetical protein [Massilia sp. CCM 9210]
MRMTYAMFTSHCFAEMSSCMAQSHGVAKDEARRLRERAYGVFMGWRVLAGANDEIDRYMSDEQKLAALLA